ncbi:MAG: hypothetical protein VB080_02855 [Propionicimonas sp.]|uniref:hypothetical protein n=1 Tax=Propionicimonas sp. TaxID=1955623 RepID=UPI002B1EA35B|nr:hypothetical protein [Propionicimonas sp.]MEA4943357.1 hypothetical protein [Propionicimonas sp.]MEA5117684.1 hypothetical protein [Propionicimonas sp.]
MTITPQQWADAGRTRSQLRTELASQRLVRLRRGAYLATPLPTDWQLHQLKLRATLPSLGPSTYFAYTSAAVAHGLPLLARRLGEVVVVRTGGGHGCVNPTLHARIAQLGDTETSIVDGLPVTSLARTVADLVRTLPYDEAVMIADAGLRRGLDRDDLLAATHKGRGCRMARRALLFADGRSESPGESLSRIRMEAAGLPAPELQQVILDRLGNFLARTDFCWEDYGIIGEFDGAVKYGRLLKPGETAADVIKAEKRREQALIDAGWIVIRWTWDDLWNHGFESRLQRAIDGRRDLLSMGIDWRLP